MALQASLWVTVVLEHLVSLPADNHDTPSQTFLRPCPFRATKPLFSGVVLFLLHQDDPHEPTVTLFHAATVAKQFLSLWVLFGQWHIARLQYVCMQGSHRNNLFEWQFSVSVIPHHLLRSAQLLWWSGRWVSRKQLWISHIPLLYVHGSPLWLMAPAGVTKDLQCCAFRVYESPENHRAVISRPTFRFVHMVLNEGCKLPLMPCGLWPDQTSDHTRMGAVVHMPTPAQVLHALFANISVHILSSSYSHSRQDHSSSLVLH